MANLEYLSSFDELTWRVDFSRAYSVRADIPWTARSEVRNWIEKCCKDTVWVWNGTSTPEIGDTNWAYKVSPREARVYLVFENAADAEMFMLKYCGNFVPTVYYGNDLYKAWHDARS